LPASANTTKASPAASTAAAAAQPPLPADLARYTLRLAGIGFPGLAPLKAFLARAALSCGASLALTVALVLSPLSQRQIIFAPLPIGMIVVYAAMPIVGCASWWIAMRRLGRAGVMEELRLTSPPLSAYFRCVERSAIARGYGWFAGVVAFPAFLAVLLAIVVIAPNLTSRGDLLAMTGAIALVLTATGSCVWVHAWWGHLLMRRRTIPLLLESFRPMRTASWFLSAFLVGAVPTFFILGGIALNALLFGGWLVSMPDAVALTVVFGMFPLVELIAWALVIFFTRRRPEPAIELPMALAR
jgi:hypothetical protein